MDDVTQKPAVISVLAARIGAGVVTAVLCLLFLLQINENRLEIKRLEEAKLLEVYSANLAREFDRAFISVQVLSVLASDDVVSEKRFMRLAEELYTQLNGVLSVQLSPAGIVTFLYPDSRSSGVKGHNLLTSPLTSASADRAIQTQSMVIDGPRPLKQGGDGLVARLPIFWEGKFWGFATAVFRLQELLERVGLDSLQRSGFDYDIWVKDPGREYISVLGSELEPLQPGISVSQIDVADQTWLLGIAAHHRGWLSEIGLVELLISLLVVWLVSSLAATTLQLLQHRNQLHQLVEERTRDLRHQQMSLSQAQRLVKMGGWHRQPGSDHRVLSQQAMALLDETEEQQSLQRFIERIDEGYQQDFRYFVNELSGGKQSIEYRLQQGEQTRWFRELVEFDAVKNEMIGTIQDITADKRSQATIWQQANIDALTQLPNIHYSRNLMQAKLTQLDAGSDMLLFVLLDIHQFKTVNDGFGQQAGDELLLAVARRLQERFPDALLVGRYIADVFLLVLARKQHNDDPYAIAAAINKHFDGPVHLQDASRFVSFHTGIARWPDDGRHVDELFRCADIALHAAKAQEAPSRCCVYRPELMQGFRELDELDIDLRIAIRDGQIFMQYQPLVDAQSGQLVAMESLVRWRHPQKGLINPEQFISRAETNGLIFSLGKAIIRLVCDDSHYFAEQGLADIRININLSRTQFLDDGFSEFLNRQLNDRFPAGQAITLEVTESYELNDYQTLLEVIDQVQHDQLQWSLDDFGTGYSSYSAIGRLPVNNIKIDRSFITRLEASDVDQAIVSNIIAMAHQLGKTVTAEGVENRQQVELLQRMQCDYLQGYYFSRPLLADDLLQYARNAPLL